MDNDLVLNAIRSLEDRRAVSAAMLAKELDVEASLVQSALDELVELGDVCTSELRTRLNEGYEFTTRMVWYHTPDREVAARFGTILSMDGPVRPRATRRNGEPAPAVSLAS
jgi:hypothetical protein